MRCSKPLLAREGMTRKLAAASPAARGQRSITANSTLVDIHSKRDTGLGMDLRVYLKVLTPSHLRRH
jgi:hypothetical protein